MDRLAIISDIHGNITALNAVLDDIASRGISRIICLGDYVTKGCNPDLVIDKIREKCEIALLGNCDDVIAHPDNTHKKFWSANKIGLERGNYLHNLPVSSEFYMSGRLIRLFHASPKGLSNIFNPMFSNENTVYSGIELHSPWEMFENTEFIGKTPNDPTPDVVGYGHIHTPNIVRFANKMLFNPGSVGIPVEMLNPGDINDKTNRFSTLSSYIILEGTYGSKELSSFSISLVRIPYDIEKEIAYLEASDMPFRKKVIKELRTACSL